MFVAYVHSQHNRFLNVCSLCTLTAQQIFQCLLPMYTHNTIGLSVFIANVCTQHNRFNSVCKLCVRTVANRIIIVIVMPLSYCSFVV